MTACRDRRLVLRARSVGAALALTSALLTAPPLIAASFRGLGALEGGDPYRSVPEDISADGSVVVGESRSALGREAFRWTADGGMVGLGTLGGEVFSSTALGVSADGQVVVGSSRSPKSGFRTEAFRWTASTGIVGLGDLPDGEYASGANGVSGDGSIVTGFSTSDVSPSWGEAYRWTQATGLVGLGVLGGNVIPTSVPRRLSANGNVIVGWGSSENGLEAFRWSQTDGMVGLGDFPGNVFQSRATGVSADGTVIVGLANSDGQTSFRWTESTGMVDLGKPPGSMGSQAWAVSADGSVVVGLAANPGDYIPTIWDVSNGMRNLIVVLEELGLGPAMTGWNLEEATAVSADGRTIVGWGYNPDGNVEGWIAYLGQPSVLEIPTLSNFLLMFLSGVLAAMALLKLRSLRG